RPLVEYASGRAGAAGTQSVSLALYFLPTLISALVYYVVNTGTIAAVMALSQRASIWETWCANFVWAAPGFIFSALGTLVATSLIDSDSIWLKMACVLSVGLVTVATHTAYRMYATKLVELRDLNASLVACLALAIDARDPYTNGH